jgi:hypothetical protein
MRFSDQFKLNKSQSELDFVDIPLHTDLPLFIDPYAISMVSDEWFIECNDLIVDYFQLIIDIIKKGNKSLALTMLEHLNEPNETHLGLSTGKSAGRGVGKDQSVELYERFKNSKAVQTGKLQDISECELVIPGISRDKISDMTVNIIKEKLFEYTKHQCELLNIPLNNVSGGFYWDSSTKKWKTGYIELPTSKNNRILLVPKIAVRYDLAYDHQEYYRHFVLDFLQAEHAKPGDSLARVLKSGKKKGQIKVCKKDLVNKYPLTKDFLYEFSNKNPIVLKRYKDSLGGKIRILSDGEIEQKQSKAKATDFVALKQKLKNIPVGSDNASEYHSNIVGMLLTIFYPELWNPAKEQEINEGRKRIDIVFNNGPSQGFFSSLATYHHIKCPYIFVECKNYTDDPQNPELDQLQGRLSDKRGMFGILVCRSVKDEDRLIKRCRDIVNNDRKYIIFLTDDDIIKLLELREKDDQKEQFSYLDSRLKEVIS